MASYGPPNAFFNQNLQNNWMNNVQNPANSGMAGYMGGGGWGGFQFGAGAEGGKINPYMGFGQQFGLGRMGGPFGGKQIFRNGRTWNTPGMMMGGANPYQAPGSMLARASMSQYFPFGSGTPSG